MTNFSKCCIRTCGHLRKPNKDGIPGCISFKFPKDVKRCQEWVRLAGDEDLIHLSLQKLNSCRYICSCHFESEQFSNKKRKTLIRSALPSIFPSSHPGPLSPELMANFPPAPIIKIAMEATQNAKASDEFFRLAPSAQVHNIPKSIYTISGSEDINYSQVQPNDSDDNSHNLGDNTNKNYKRDISVVDSNLEVEPALKKLALSVDTNMLAVGPSEYELLEALEENDPFNSDAENITIVTSFTPEPMPDHEYCNRAHLHPTHSTPEQRTQEFNSALQKLPQELLDEYMTFLQLTLKHISRMNVQAANNAINGMKQALLSSEEPN